MILPIFLANRLSVGKIVLVPADIQYFGDISADISDFLFLASTFNVKSIYEMLIGLIQSLGTLEKIYGSSIYYIWKSYVQEIIFEIILKIC